MAQAVELCSRDRAKTFDQCKEELSKTLTEVEFKVYFERNMANYIRSIWQNLSSLKCMTKEGETLLRTRISEQNNQKFRRMNAFFEPEEQNPITPLYAQNFDEGFCTDAFLSLIRRAIDGENKMECLRAGKLALIEKKFNEEVLEDLLSRETPLYKEKVQEFITKEINNPPGSCYYFIRNLEDKYPKETYQKFRCTTQKKDVLQKKFEELVKTTAEEPSSLALKFIESSIESEGCALLELNGIMRVVNKKLNAECETKKQVYKDQLKQKNDQYQKGNPATKEEFQAIKDQLRETHYYCYQQRNVIEKEAFDPQITCTKIKRENFKESYLSCSKNQATFQSCINKAKAIATGCSEADFASLTTEAQGFLKIGCPEIPDLTNVCTEAKKLTYKFSLLTCSKDEASFDSCNSQAKTAATGCTEADFTNLNTEAQGFLRIGCPETSTQPPQNSRDCKDSIRYSRLFERCKINWIASRNKNSFKNCVRKARRTSKFCKGNFNIIERKVNKRLNQIFKYLKKFNFNTMSKGFFITKVYFIFDLITSSKMKPEYNRWLKIYKTFIRAYQIAQKNHHKNLKKHKKFIYPRIPKFNPRGTGYDITVQHTTFDTTGYSFKDFDPEFLRVEIDWITFTIKNLNYWQKYQAWAKTYSNFKKQVKQFFNRNAKFQKIPKFDPYLDQSALHQWETTQHGEEDFFVFHGEKHNIRDLSDAEVDGYCEEYLASLQGQLDGQTFAHLRHEYLRFVNKAQKTHKRCNCPLPARK